MVDVFNVFNRQSAVQLDERYNLIQDGVCAGIPTLTPAGQLADPRATSTNPDFLKKGILFTDPRSIRVGVLLTF